MKIAKQIIRPLFAVSALGLLCFESFNAYSEWHRDTLGLSYLLKQSWDIKDSAPDKALSLCYEALHMAIQTRDSAVMATCYHYLGTYYNDLSQTDAAVDNFSASIRIKMSKGDTTGTIVSLNNLGIAYENSGNFSNALKSYTDALNLSKLIGQQDRAATMINNIGLLYFNMGKDDDAMFYYRKSIALHRQNNDSFGLASLYGNMAGIYWRREAYDSAMALCEQALLIDSLNGNYRQLAIEYNRIALLYLGMKKYDDAKQVFMRSLHLSERLGDKRNVANILYNQGKLYLETGQIKKAINSFENASELSARIKALDLQLSAEKDLYQIFDSIGDSRKRYKHYTLYSMLDDSVYSSALKRETGRLVAKAIYDQELLKQTEEQKRIQSLAEAKRQRTTYVTIAGASGLVIALFFALIAYRRYRYTREQQAVIALQKEAVAEKNKEITDSITYAKRIQSAILPPQKLVKEYLHESFILYKPKDIVAGDFYWLQQINSPPAKGEYPKGEGVISPAKGNHPVSHSADTPPFKGGEYHPVSSSHPSFAGGECVVYFAAADCTGHGVPGAMVSVVCNNALNRAVREYGLTDPGKILDKARELVVAEFEKSEEDVKDGMDIALCALQGHILQYAGANNPLWLIRKNEDGVAELVEVKPDKQPIGKYAEAKPFTTHKIELQKGDSIYIFSDGFADQFGGPKGKKFKYKPFKKLLLSIQDKAMEEQRTIIDQKFEEWRGSLEQIDDVCVLGVRL